MFIIVFAYLRIYSVVKNKKAINADLFARDKIKNLNNNITLKYKASIKKPATNRFLSKTTSNFNQSSVHFEQSISLKKSYDTMETSFTTDNTTTNINNKHRFIRLLERRNAIKTSVDLLKIKPRDYVLQRELKVAKMVLIKISLFCIAWTPYVVVILCTQFATNIEDYITPQTTSLPSLFAKSSVIFNALVYTLIHKECRTYYFEMIFRK